MTTTLRPAGPLQQSADGTAARTFEVCVNSRPVGEIELGTSAGFGPAAGEIRSLRIDEADRRRGRGTVAALAAEEVLRGWRCEQVLVSIPAAATAAHHLAAALGYTERGRNMSKPLTTAPEPLPGLTVRPMTEAEFEDFAGESREGFARDWIERGVPEAQARAKAETSQRELLPDGLATEGAVLRVVTGADGRVVGRLWTGERERSPGERMGYVYDIEVAADQRGRGIGRALMGCAERTGLERGYRHLGLHVFADNPPALRLYTSLGYETTYINSYKPLL
ncbi:GNAT family N-acetyltransferase [Streptomyces sp. LP05-1]|uniref:GNAT family N-acetyltransferase n=1 Tax=Streptomyces pyxinae TaxID=2970734 RepID=A0ABT2CGJ9_9ACTN|nr:GNAT family N-acetyltransferase [Streptomyces sp. LP05-1]MCS0636227.1 GNAT family N-acetyltransferase [Streptomyces sp. LP05-1]